MNQTKCRFSMCKVNDVVGRLSAVDASRSMEAPGVPLINYSHY